MDASDDSPPEARALTPGAAKRRSALLRRRLAAALAVVAAALLVLASLVTFGLMTRYEPVDAEPVLNPDFQRAVEVEPRRKLPGWDIEGDPAKVVAEGGRLRLENHESGQSVGIRQVIVVPEGVRAFRVSARIALENVQAGPERSQRARVYLAGLTRGGAQDFSRPHNLLRASGSSPAMPYSGILEVAPAHRTALLVMRLQRATGAMEIADLVVEPLRHRPQFTAMRWGLGLGWSVLAIVAGWRFLQGSADRRAAWTVIAIAAAAGSLALMPHDLRAPILAALGDRERGDTELLRWATLAGHLLFFMVLAGLVRLARSRDRLLVVAAAVFALAGVVEAAEMVAGRLDRGDLGDLAVNLVGAGLGLVLAEGAARRGRRRKRRGRRRSSRDTGRHEPRLARQALGATQKGRT